MKGNETNCDIAFFATYKIHARKVRQVCSKLGYKMVTIDDVCPEHFKISDKVRLNLYAWDLTPDHRHYDSLRNYNAIASDADAEFELA